MMKYLEQAGIPRREPKLMNLKGGEHPNWKGSGSVPGWYWSSVRNGAKTRQIEVAVDVDHVARLFENQGGRCAYTGLPLTFGTADRRSDGTASLDRIDSDRGYVEGNLRWVHKDIQPMKMAMSHDRFVALCRLVAHHQEQNG